MKLTRFARYATALAFAGFALGASAAGQEKGVASVVDANNKKLVYPWITIKPGQSDKSGFALSRDGVLSYAGNAFQSRIEVSDDKGRPSTRPSSVAISPVSPSGRFALLTACEPVPSPSNLCWFQYLVDIPNRKLNKAAWAKYPTPAYVWWGKEDAFAVIPISDEGETWLSAFDLNTRDSRDIHFYEAVLAAVRPLQCKPTEDDFAIDLNSLNWVGKSEVALSVAVKCGAKPEFLSGTVKLGNGAIKLSPAGTQQQARTAASPSFDCGKASSTVEKTICADPNLAQLDSQLMALYQQAMRQADNSDALKSQQLNWLRQVRNPCTSVSCLTSAYQQRIAELQKGGAATAPSWSPSPFPATYSGGFTGKEKLTFTADGRLLEEGAPAGRYQVDTESFWPDAKYPLLLIQPVNGKTEKTHCKIQPDMRKLLCNYGGSATAEFDRVGAAPMAKLPVAKKCDEEQLYLDVMAAARKARPDLELKGATDIRLGADGKCRINLYYLKNGEAIDLPAVYDLTGRPVNLIFSNKR